MTSVVPTRARRSARLLAYSHATVDLYQGAVAALVPFLVLERGYSYAASAGIVLAFSLSSSVVQPIFGALGDRWRMPWLIPVSILLAGLGIGAVSVSEYFWVTATVVGVSGVGVAAFHPAAAGRARELARDDHVVMAWFSLGGNIGFAAGPLVVAPTIGLLGLAASPLLVVPALTGVVAVALAGRRRARPSAVGGAASTRPRGRDDWSAFGRLSVAIVCRSIVFVGLGSFLVLFMGRHEGVGEAAAAASLFVFYAGGAFGTAIGGHLARRWPRTSILRGAYLAAVPLLAGLLLVPGPAAFLLVPLVSVALYVPFSLHVSLGQDYLPRHMGTANGVTLGLAVSIGGLASPAIGALADRVGLQQALLPMIALPAIAALALVRLRDPRSATAGDAGGRAPGGDGGPPSADGTGRSPDDAGADTGAPPGRADARA
ncbi:MFS transporter [Georgenia sp. Z1491]|uniref:MFS transporter n=1 Tax=Georgenia sp. Z1491 TaxID=3416707 RepID=UPI003CEC5C91